MTENVRYRDAPTEHYHNKSRAVLALICAASHEVEFIVVNSRIKLRLPGSAVSCLHVTRSVGLRLSKRSRFNVPILKNCDHGDEMLLRTTFDDGSEHRNCWREFLD